MEFAAKVRKLLKSRGLSQADLAAALGTKQQTVSRWLETNTPPKWHYLLGLARALGVPADYLIDRDQDAPPRELGEDERALLAIIRALRLDREEATRRLYREVQSVQPSPSGDPQDVPIKVEREERKPPPKSRRPGAAG